MTVLDPGSHPRLGAEGPCRFYFFAAAARLADMIHCLSRHLRAMAEAAGKRRTRATGRCRRRAVTRDLAWARAIPKFKEVT
jgi:hypothetical protein